MKTQLRRNGPRAHSAITYARPAVFRLGVAAVVTGSALHLPMFVGAGEMHYRLAGMRADLPMRIGMVLIVAGIAGTLYGLLPRSPSGSVSQIRVRALDDAPIRPAHVALIVVMTLAVTIDVMKPTTLAFVAPGAAAEYGLRSPLDPSARVPVALYPLAGITGTVLGSFAWGWLGDRIGRRASILLSGVLFIATGVCGAMPDFYWNLATCFVMGLGVGGMLPIVFALMAETIPARHRGWLMVLVGGDVAGAYVITSWLASTIGAPDRFGWRILWLIGLPTGLVLILLNRYMPESPRYLLANGRDEDARAIMRRYGAVVEHQEHSELEVEAGLRGSYRQLLSGPFLGLTLTLVLLGLGIGAVQFGFQQWIPSNLQHLGYDAVEASRTLRNAGLIGFPLNVPVSLLYGLWSGKKTIALLSAVTAAALFGFVAAGDGVVDNAMLLEVLLVIPIWGISSLTAVTVAYASEVYPTRVRSRGTGLAAGATKVGGVTVLAMVSVAVATPSISRTALFGALPLSIAVVAMLVFGVETTRKRLEQITAEELHTTTV